MPPGSFSDILVSNIVKFVQKELRDHWEGHMRKLFNRRKVSAKQE